MTMESDIQDNAVSRETTLLRELERGMMERMHLYSEIHRVRAVQHGKLEQLVRMHEAESEFEDPQEEPESLKLIRRGVKILRHSLKALDTIDTRHANEFANLEASWKKKLNRLAESCMPYQADEPGKGESGTGKRGQTENDYKFWCLNIPKRRHVRSETWDPHLPRRMKGDLPMPLREAAISMAEYQLRQKPKPVVPEMPDWDNDLL